jgi:hypothetical protein
VLREAVTLPCCVLEYSCCYELHRQEIYHRGNDRGMGERAFLFVRKSVVVSYAVGFCSPVGNTSTNSGEGY